MKALSLTAITALGMCGGSVAVAEPSTQGLNGSYRVVNDAGVAVEKWTLVTNCDSAACVTHIVDAGPPPSADPHFAKPRDIGDAFLIDGRWTIAVPVPQYCQGGTAEREMFSWDPSTLAGMYVREYTGECDGRTGVVVTYPIHLVKGLIAPG